MTFIEEKIQSSLNQINNRIITQKFVIDNIKYCYADYKTENTPPKNIMWQDYKVMSMPTKADGHIWFCFSAYVPDVASDELAYLRVTTGCSGWDAMNPQGTLFIDGDTALQAFDVNHLESPINSGKHNVNIYFYGHPNPGDIRFEASVIVKNKLIEKLYYDIKVPFEAMKFLDKNSYDYANTINALDRACMYLDFRNQETNSFISGVNNAIEFLENEYYQKYCGKENNGELACIGHTHIDVAWLWTLAQTQEKAQRSFATAISLMEQYPDYIFMSSQPQLYEYVKQNDPELYEKIKVRIKEGRWEAEGAMWLEADTNLASGESLIRQILYGKRFMNKEFGIDNTILWLPDVFGYSAALPQIMKKCGVDKFFTTKLSWNETNEQPHDNFIWQGIDGSEVFAVLTDSYSKNLNSELAKSSIDKHVDKKYSALHPCTIGFADGGGGTTPEMMENFLRLKRGLPGIPKVTMRKVGETLEIIEKQFKENSQKLCFTPKWVGELYLEMHRGTYTTMAENKKNNRKSEILYQSAEAASVIAEVLNSHKYPADILEENWYTILKNQFHDIIPGSSIKAVYDDSRKEYEKVLSIGKKILDDAINSLARNIKTNGGYLVYNPTSFKRSEVIECDGEMFFAENIPAFGYKVIKPENVARSTFADKKHLENEYLSVKFDDNYNIISFYDKENEREIIKENKIANVLEIFEDYPRAYDAWEITEYYKQKKWIADNIVSAEVINKPYYSSVIIKRKYNLSQIIQEIRLTSKSRRLDFITDIDWHEDHVLLKAAFPLNIRTNKADCDIQFGFIDRPTHYNTPWDQAKFEICAHKWVDMSESDYGVALLNDCKYGYSIQDEALKISLLKAPTYPNPEADRGKHHFIYSLYPHDRNLTSSDVIKQGYVLNYDLKAKKLEKNICGTLPETYFFVSSDCESAVIETVKKAEDNNGYIIRLYDSKNTNHIIKLNFGCQIKKAYYCDMLENIEKEEQINDNTVQVRLTNFEIKTLRIGI